jgi:hypothetical protein
MQYDFHVQAEELALEQRLRREVISVESTPQLAATLDVLIGIEPRRTAPAFAELAVVDEMVFARARTHEEFEYFLGHRDNLAERLRDLANFLELGRGERELLAARLARIPALGGDSLQA